jgi:hypothetical protein
MISTVPLSVVEDLGIPIQAVEIPGLKIDGTGSIDVPYLGQVDIRTTIPSIQGYHKIVPFLVVHDGPGTNPVQIGTNIIDDAIPLMLESEIQEGDEAWTYAARLRSLAFREEVRQAGAELHDRAPVFRGSQLPKCNIRCKSRKAVVLPPNSTQRVVTHAPVHLLEKRCHFAAEDIAASPTGPITAWSVKPTYCENRRGSGKITALVTNNTDRPLKIKKGQTVCDITPSNVIPPWVDPEG